MSVRILFFGPVCCGKGYISKLLFDDTRHTHLVGIGDITRHKLEKCPDFNNMFGRLVSSGNYLPDEIARDILLENTQTKKDSGLIIDGYCRTAQQVRLFESDGFIEEETVFVILNATHQTCHNNFIDAAERRQKRPDNHMFNYRFGLSERHRDDVLKTMRRICRDHPGSRVIQINANRKIAKEVYPDVKIQLTAILGKKFTDLLVTESFATESTAMKLAA